MILRVSFRQSLNLVYREATMKRTFLIICVVAIASLASLGAQQAPAPAQSGFKRTMVQQADLSAAGREVVQAIAEIQPGAESGRHTHPGEEVAYVLEGTIMLEIQGKPAVAKKAGDGFIVPPNTVHNAKNTSKAVAKVLGTYIIEKGKPVATPVTQ
jgi:quercetin dioxygenase-like cupin family protein